MLPSAASKDYVTHVLEAIRTLGHGPGDLGTLSLQALEAIGTMGPCPLRLSGPWDMVP